MREDNDEIYYQLLNCVAWISNCSQVARQISSKVGEHGDFKRDNSNQQKKTACVRVFPSVDYKEMMITRLKKRCRPSFLSEVIGPNFSINDFLHDNSTNDRTVMNNVRFL